ncbi:MAG TPA: glutamate-5-semialdehyde dehydrogenase [Bacteroidetes bacterium]|nr:glutamate-5-semialdehyde dehydrogenase [Bacteroidota bacterium]
MKKTIIANLHRLRQNARSMPGISPKKINAVLNDLAAAAEANTAAILAENKKDLDRMDASNPKYDRLLLDEGRIKNIAADLRNVAALPSPLNIVLEERTLPNGLQLKKTSVPLGTIGIVFESRPNVTFDVFSLCFKSGNASVLKGSRDAHFSNIAIVEIIKKILADHGLPPLVYLAPSERESLKHILEADGYIDTIIPRGSQGLIGFVRENAKVPVIETGAGIVHVYVDKSADLQKAAAIVKNSKTRRVSVCNALDALLVHEERLADLPAILDGFDTEFNCGIYADERAFSFLKNHYRGQLLHPADGQSFGTEFLSMNMAIKTVASIDEALDHVFAHSSKHTESIVAEDETAIEKYLANVDAAVVLSNAATCFTDGAQFGLGAEIGISTQKLHARGPMALRELTSYKWVIRGDGQVRG